MKVDKTYWQNMSEHPYCPNHEDVKTYLSLLLEGETLLLGCTRNLLPCSTHQMDIDPWYTGSSVIVKDWRYNNNFYTNIIGDGVLNFDKDLTDAVLSMASRFCKSFVVRSFNFKLSKMKVAAHFPREDEFAIKPNKVLENREYNFYQWNF